MEENTNKNSLKDNIIFILKKRGVVLGAVLVLIVGCLLYAPSIVQTNTRVGDRELPIYCVDTTEKKVALSFDAAWGDGE